MMERVFVNVNNHSMELNIPIDIFVKNSTFEDFKMTFDLVYCQKEILLGCIYTNLEYSLYIIENYGNFGIDNVDPYKIIPEVFPLLNIKNNKIINEFGWYNNINKYKLFYDNNAFKAVCLRNDDRLIQIIYDKLIDVDLSYYHGQSEKLLSLAHNVYIFSPVIDDDKLTRMIEQDVDCSFIFESDGIDTVNIKLLRLGRFYRDVVNYTGQRYDIYKLLNKDPLIYCKNISLRLLKDMLLEKPSNMLHFYKNPNNLSKLSQECFQMVDFKKIPTINAYNLEQYQHLLQYIKYLPPSVNIDCNNDVSYIKALISYGGNIEQFKKFNKRAYNIIIK